MFLYRVHVAFPMNSDKIGIGIDLAENMPSNRSYTSTERCNVHIFDERSSLMLQQTIHDSNETQVTPHDNSTS